MSGRWADTPGVQVWVRPSAPIHWFELSEHSFDSETDPDIDVIDAENNTYKCHKAVLSQSEVLAKSFDPQLGFKVRH